ncbi:phosphatase PAP2 family protein [Sporosarcina sp. CAU 1771]
MKKLSTVFSICIALGISFSYLAISISTPTIKRFDSTIISFVQALETPWLTSLLKFFTWIGSGFIAVLLACIVSLILFFVFQYKNQAALLLVGIAGTGLLNIILKLFFKRERPEIYRLADASGYSFPSGHTMLAFSLYILLGFIVWRNVTTRASRVLLVISIGMMITLIAGSRIYLGVHYPSDIAGGILASALWIVPLLVAYRTYIARKIDRV